MLDRDLATLYDTETKILNLAVKRNIKRFPGDFMFQLTKEEHDSLSAKLVTLERPNNSLRFQIETSKSRGGRRYLPYAFTEQGIAMLSGIINSDKAINMNIAIMRAFIDIRRVVNQKNEVKEQLKEIQQKISEHTAQLSQIFATMETISGEKAAERKWLNREKIGFKTEAN